MLNAIALILHLIAINVWVGGTFFAWTWLAVAILQGTGTWMVYVIHGGFDNIPPYIMLIGLFALLMVVSYTYIFCVLYRRYQRLL